MMFKVDFMRALAAVNVSMLAQSAIIRDLIAPAAFLEPGAAPHRYDRRTSKYMPHQGERECARRRRQMSLT